MKIIAEKDKEINEIKDISGEKERIKNEIEELDLKKEQIKQEIRAMEKNYTEEISKLEVEHVKVFLICLFNA